MIVVTVVSGVLYFARSWRLLGVPLKDAAAGTADWANEE